VCIVALSGKISAENKVVGRALQGRTRSGVGG
jgi:hypothetical protein